MMPYNSVAFLVNHINFAIATKRRWIFFRYTNKMLGILKLFKKLGLVNSYFLINNSNASRSFIKISPFFYKNSSFYKNVKLISTPSKRFNISLRSLQILNKSVGDTIIILETSRGILTHKDALSLRIGGKLLFVIN